MIEEQPVDCIDRDSMCPKVITAVIPVFNEAESLRGFKCYRREALEEIRLGGEPSAKPVLVIR